MSRLVIKFTQECEALVAGSYEVAEFGNFWSMKKEGRGDLGFSSSQENHRKITGKYIYSKNGVNLV